MEVVRLVFMIGESSHLAERTQDAPDKRLEPQSQWQGLQKRGGAIHGTPTFSEVSEVSEVSGVSGVSGVSERGMEPE